jgi:hypothetical protein
MKIAILGSAPSSVRLAPYADPSWQIWGCSPGVYPVAARVDVWFELHRWEPPVLGRADQQKPWFSPEYCGWMAQQKLVWMSEKVAEIPNSQTFDWQSLVKKYGSYYFTSSIAWMLAAAIESILHDRETRTDKTVVDAIGLFGVDMAANEEYATQRPGCQFFIQIAYHLGIEVVVPPESDLMAPPLLYGIGESTRMLIKLTERKRELETRLNNCNASLANLTREQSFLSGALDDINYMWNTWTNNGESYAADFKSMFVPKQNTSPEQDFYPGEVKWVSEEELREKTSRSKPDAGNLQS